MTSGVRILAVLFTAAMLAVGAAAAQQAPAGVTFTRPYPEFREIVLTPPAPISDPAIWARRTIFTYEMSMDQARRMIATGEGILEGVQARQANPDPRQAPEASDYDRAVLKNMPRTLELERAVLATAKPAIHARRPAMEQEIRDLAAEQRRVGRDGDFAEMTDVTNRYVAAQRRLADLLGPPGAPPRSLILPPTPPPPRPSSFPVLPPPGAQPAADPAP